MEIYIYTQWVRMDYRLWILWIIKSISIMDFLWIFYGMDMNLVLNPFGPNVYIQYTPLNRAIG